MIKVLVVFGTVSSEHEISCISASNVIENLDKNKYDVKYLGIDKKGDIFRYFGNVSTIAENKWIEDEKNKEKVIDFLSELKKYDVIFPVLHGKYGEDGKIQGVFEFANVKYVGCKVLGSSIAMNKSLSKKLVKNINIPIVEYIELDKKEYINITTSKEIQNEFLNKIDKELSFPIIVKPNEEGSSYGVVKVDKKDDVKEALEFAFKYDAKLLIEKYIDNRQEVECAVIQKENEIYASTAGEIKSANEFYDFDAKYNNTNSYVKIPAVISKEQMEMIRKYAVEIFKALELQGLARVDFFVSNNNIYFNEVNTMPGFTNISMYPKMLINDGISYSEILDILIKNSMK